MGVATTAAIISTTNAAAANAAAHAAKVSMCKGVIANFDSKGPSVSQMQEYASCVDTVYPKEMTGGEVFWFKMLFVLAIVGMVAGVWRGRQDYCTGAFLGGLAGFILVPIAAVCIWAFGCGVVWLFS